MSNKIKLIAIIIGALAIATVAYAECTSQTITVNGKTQYCTKCCDDNGNCQWSCV